MPVEDLDTWSDIVETGKKGSELGMEEDWSIDKEGEREVMNTETI